MHEEASSEQETSKAPSHSDEHIESVMEPTKLKPIIVRMPRDRGITGMAI